MEISKSVYLLKEVDLAKRVSIEFIRYVLSIGVEIKDYNLVRGGKK